MSSPERVELARAILRAVVCGRGVRDLEPRIAPHHALHVPLPMFVAKPGIRALRELSVVIHRVLSEVELFEGEAISEGRVVALRFGASALHTGSIGAERPTGQRIHLSGLVEFCMSVDGNDVVETWAQWSFFGMLRQIGAVRIRNATATVVA